RRTSSSASSSPPARAWRGSATSRSSPPTRPRRRCTRCPATTSWTSPASVRPARSTSTTSTMPIRSAPTSGDLSLILRCRRSVGALPSGWVNGSAPPCGAVPPCGGAAPQSSRRAVPQSFRRAAQYPFRRPAWTCPGRGAGPSDVTWQTRPPLRRDLRDPKVHGRVKNSQSLPQTLAVSLSSPRRKGNDGAWRNPRVFPRCAPHHRPRARTESATVPTGTQLLSEQRRRPTVPAPEQVDAVKKTPWIVAAAAACVIGAGGGGTAFAMSNEAAVNLYGEETSVRTFSPTVAELLEAQGIEVKDNDLVIPGLEEQVTDGLEIQIIERFPVTVTIDGEEQELLTTSGTVGEALEEIDFEAEGARISAEPETQLDASGTEVDIVTRKTVTFVGQYGEDTFEVAALTVGEAMDKVLTDIEDTDTADVDRDTPLVDGATHEIQRVRETERTETEAIPFETTTEEDDSLLEGRTKTTTEGKQGEVEKVYSETVVDGE